MSFQGVLDARRQQPGSAGSKMGRPSALDHREDVLAADDQQVLAVKLEFGAGVLRVQDLVADSDVHGLAGAVIEDLARADGDVDEVGSAELRGPLSARRGVSRRSSSAAAKRRTVNARLIATLSGCQIEAIDSRNTKFQPLPKTIPATKGPIHPPILTIM